MFNSLKKKILTVIISITVVFTMVFMALSYYEVTRAVENQMKNDGATLITQLNRQLKGYSLKQSNEIGSIFKNVIEESKGNILYISIVDKNMKMLISSDDHVKEKTGIKQEGSEKDVSGGNSTDEVSGATINEKEATNIAVSKETTGFIFKTPEGKRAYNVATPFYDGRDLVGSINVGISIEDMHQLITKGMVETVVISLIIISIAIVISVIFSSRITKPLNDIVKKLDAFAGGDFTLKFDCGSKDEVGRLTKGLNNTIAVLRESVGGIKHIVEELNVASGDLASASDAAAVSGQVVEKAVAEVFNGVSDQTLNIVKVAETISDFSETLDNIRNKSEYVVESSDRIKKSADIGSQNLEYLIVSIGDVTKSFSIAEDRIQSLNTDTAKIGAITDVINNVAEQTNLLALNAAIEAARAGEAGRGFSVVADEIRKLAEQVMESSKTINQLIHAVKNGTAEVNSNTKSISEKIKDQVFIVENTVSSFDNIQKDVDKSLIQMKETYSLIEGTVDEKEEITHGVEALSAISEEVSASAKEISESAEEQASNVMNLSKLSKTLNNMADRLAQNINKFKI